MPFAISGPFAVLFETGVTGRTIDPDNPNTDWIASCLLKFAHLPDKITNNPVNLLDHRFGKDFCLSANFYVCDIPPGHDQPLLGNCDRSGYYFAERPITAAAGLSDGLVAEVNDAVFFLNPVR